MRRWFRDFWEIAPLGFSFGCALGCYWMLRTMKNALFMEFVGPEYLPIAKLASMAFLLGILSLAGMPLTAGFPGQWALMQALGSNDWYQVVVVLAGALGLVVGLMRSLSALLGPLRNLLLEREERVMIVLAAVGLLAILAPALYPAIWQDSLNAVVAVFAAASGGL